MKLISEFRLHFLSAQGQTLRIDVCEMPCLWLKVFWLPQHGPLWPLSKGTGAEQQVGSGDQGVHLRYRNYSRSDPASKVSPNLPVSYSCRSRGAKSHGPQRKSARRRSLNT